MRIYLSAYLPITDFLGKPWLNTCHDWQPYDIPQIYTGSPKKTRNPYRISKYRNSFKTWVWTELLWDFEVVLGLHFFGTPGMSESNLQRGYSDDQAGPWNLHQQSCGEAVARIPLPPNQKLTIKLLLKANYEALYPFRIGVSLPLIYTVTDRY